MAVNKGEIGIYGVLRRDGGDGVLAKTDQVKDTNLNKTQEQLNQEVINNIANKIDKVEGKSLISDTEITKLSNLPNKANLDSAIADAKKTGTDAQTNLTAHIDNKENPHEVTKEQVGLGNVTNEAQIPLSQKGTASGVATLGTDGKLTAAQLPTMKTVNGVSVVGSGNISIDLSLYKVVDSLPTTGIDTTKVYIVPAETTEDKNIKAEYVYTGDPASTYDATKWEKLGEAQTNIVVDTEISNTSTNPVSNAAISTYINSTVSTIESHVTNGTWLPVKKGNGEGSVIVGGVSGADGNGSFAEGNSTRANGIYSHAEGQLAWADGYGSHAEGYNTQAVGDYSHAEGYYNYADINFLNVVGIGNTQQSEGKNAFVIYATRTTNNEPDLTNYKTGYLYLIDVGGYTGKGINTAKSVQEVIADLETSLTNKVDNVEGKQLSTNDYTTVDKNKVAESINESAANTLINTAIGKLTKASVGLNNVDNTADANKEVLSATKLKTAHTFWGQPFDGTANVSGDIIGIGKGTTAKLDIQKIAAPGKVDYIHMFVTEAQRPLVLQNGYGNVGIGVVAPVEKFEVDGNIKLTGSVKNVTEIYTTDGSKYAEPCTEDDIKALFA